VGAATPAGGNKRPSVDPVGSTVGSSPLLAAAP
jgi:hypothetical protein